MLKQLSRSVLRKRSLGNMHQIYRRTPMLKCDFNKVPLLSCKFAAYFQNIFSKDHLSTAASDCVKTQIWSKSVIKKLQFDEKNKSPGCYAIVTFTVALKFNGNKEMNSSQTHLLQTSSIILQVFRMSNDSQRLPIFMKFSNFLLYGGLS